MGLLDKFRLDPRFRELEDWVAELAKAVRAAERDGVVYRIVPPNTAELEVEQWVRYGGFKVGKSRFGRMPVTRNRLLACLIERGVVRPGPRGVALLLKIRARSEVGCVKYTDALLGKYPVFRLGLQRYLDEELKQVCERMPSPEARAACRGERIYAPEGSGIVGDDILYKKEDLVLAECWLEDDVPVSAIEEIYVNPRYPEAERLAERLAKASGARIVWGIPCWEEGVDAEKVEKLGRWLSERGRRCPTLHDPVFGALAEAYDRRVHGQLGYYSGVPELLAERLREEVEWKRRAGYSGADSLLQACLSV